MSRRAPGLLAALLFAAAGGLQPPAGYEKRGRDPFRPPPAAAEAARPPGLRGVGILEAVIRGVVRFGAGASGGLAVLESRSGEGFVAAPGDRLMDGVLDRVEAAGVTFLLDGDADRKVFRPLGVSGEER